MKHRQERDEFLHENGETANGKISISTGAYRAVYLVPSVRSDLSRNCNGFLRTLGTRSRRPSKDRKRQAAAGRRCLNAIKVVIRCRFHFLRDDVDARSFVIAPTSSRGLHDLLPPFPFSRPTFPADDFFVTIRACDVRPRKMNVFPR